MNCVGKVDCRRAEGQRNNVALRREDEGLVVEDVGLEGMDKLVGITRALIRLKKLGYPAKLLVNIRLRRLVARLVLPVCRNTVLCLLVHLYGTDLYLEGNSAVTDNGGVKRTVKVRLWRGNVVLESTGNRFEYLVNVAECGVTLKLGLHYDADGVEVVYLVKGLVLAIHFTVKAVNRLYPALNAAADVILGKFLGNKCLGLIDEITAPAEFLIDLLLHLLIAYVIKVEEAEILKLLLDSLDTETVSQGCVNIHRLKGDGTLAILLLCRKSTHIMKSVAELDKDNADILGHSEQHLTDVLNMSLLLIGNLYLNYFSKSVDEKSHLLAEHLGNDLKIGLIGTVLHRIVKEGCTDRVGVKTELGNDRGHRNGMADIRLAAETHLSLVELICIVIGLDYLVEIVRTVVF